MQKMISKNHKVKKSNREFFAILIEDYWCNSNKVFTFIISQWSDIHKIAAALKMPFLSRNRALFLVLVTTHSHPPKRWASLKH